MKQEKELLTQTEIAREIGISKGTLSKWITKNNVSPKQEKGNKKLYSRKLVKQYLDSKKSNDSKESHSFSTIDFLKSEVDRKRDENKVLRDRISDLEKQLNEKNQQVYDLADKFAKLADQAQQLNLADKQVHKLESKETVSDEETKQETLAAENEELKKKLDEMNHRSFWQRVFGK